MATARRGEDGYQDGYAETKAIIKAIDRGVDPTALPKRTSKLYMSCRRCRQGGYTGEYPFSTAPNTGLCDDCL
jgi:hypothetical protein